MHRQRRRTEEDRLSLFQAVEVDPSTDLEGRPMPDLDEDLRVEGVHDGQRQVVVEDGRRYLQGRVLRVFSVAGVFVHSPDPGVDEVVPADNRNDPEERQEPDEGDHHQTYKQQSSSITAAAIMS